MQELPYPIFMIADRCERIRLTTSLDDNCHNVLAIFSLHDLAKLHFLVMTFKHRGAVFLVESGGTGFYKKGTYDNAIVGDRWCIGVGLTDRDEDGMCKDLAEGWFWPASRKVSYRVNPDIRVWLTWPTMNAIVSTLENNLLDILDQENRVDQPHFISTRHPALQFLGPSRAGLAYVKDVCVSIRDGTQMPDRDWARQFLAQIHQAILSDPNVPSSKKIAKDEYVNIYRRHMDGDTDTSIAKTYNVSNNTVRRVILNMKHTIYKYRERSWNMWQSLFEEVEHKCGRNPL